jgi:hypothetical protein
MEDEEKKRRGDMYKELLSMNLSWSVCASSPNHTCVVVGWNLFVKHPPWSPSFSSSAPPPSPSAVG